MRIFILKVLCWLYLANIFLYSNANIDSKNAYIESELKRKLSTKDHRSNRYEALLTANSKNSKIATTQRPTWNHLNSQYSYSNLNSVRLRHSRYPNLDLVSTRLDKLRTTHIVTTTNPPKYQYQKLTKNSDNLLINNNDSEDLLDYEDNDVDGDNLTDYDSADIDDNAKYGDDDDEDLLDGWQAEEATESSPTSLTEYKWQLLGTRSRVEESRRNQNLPQHSNSYVEVNAAIEHAVRMNTASRCRDPFPRVMSVQNIHPDPRKSYFPHCTVLHRCAEDTGCCPGHSLTCAPKKQTIVYLYFYTSMLGQAANKVEKLPFYNHTECACLDKSTEPTTLEAAPEPNREVTRSYRSNLSVRAADSSLYSPETMRKCKCPKEYSALLNSDNKCACDCSETNMDCRHIKDGHEHISFKDRRCIMDGECAVPRCEYGAYIRDLGRCPLKQEKLDAFASVSTN